MTLDEIARVTRIPLRSLERLEAGAFEDLPADVFVRGFLRSYASCVGLDADEAIRRYVACGLEAETEVVPLSILAPVPVSVSAAEAPVEASPVPASDVAAAVIARPALTVSAYAVGVSEEGAKRTRRRRGKRGKGRGRAHTALPGKGVEVASESVAASDAVQPVEQRGRPLRPLPRPTLIIDDDDPERAERQREERDAAETDQGWRSFLPQFDDDQRPRQGGLTLAVIILLIVATLTLSYLMRRPSTSGDGVTQAPGAVLEDGVGPV